MENSNQDQEFRTFIKWWYIIGGSIFLLIVGLVYGFLYKPIDSFAKNINIYFVLGGVCVFVFLIFFKKETKDEKYSIFHEVFMVGLNVLVLHFLSRKLSESVLEIGYYSNWLLMFLSLFIPLTAWQIRKGYINIYGGSKCHN